MCWWLVLCAAALAGAAGPGAEGPALLGAADYELRSAVLLNDAARADRDVGYQLRATLRLRPLWAARADALLHFQLLSPKLYLRGKHVNADFMPYDSVWDSYSDTSFYAHWSHGLIEKAYLNPSELPDVLNYKKAILSLFQFQVLDGERNETDVSGPCLVLYETISTEEFRKIKRGCSEDGAGGALSGARRVARYSLSGARDALLALHADELLALGPGALGLKARSWHTLRRLAARPAPPAAASLRAALHALPGGLRALPLALADAPAAPDQQELSTALQVNRAALVGEGAGEGGGSEAAGAVLQLLPPLRSANSSALLQLLRRDDMHDALPGLCRALGLAGTRAAHAAAAAFLQLGAREPLQELALAYLAGFALAPAPHDAAVLELLRLAEEARARAVADAALLAAAAAAAAAPAAAQRVRDVLARGLARCKDERCRVTRLRALANLRRADTADLLLEHAERGGAPALAALDALQALPERALTFARLDRLGALALDERAALELRAAALDLVVERRAELPAPLAGLAYALHERGPHELRRVLWQRMAALAPRHAPLRALPGLLEPALRGWDAQAHGGTSSVLVRGTGWHAAGWRAQLQSVQVARAGLLRRGVVRLLAHDHDDHTFDALTVEVWSRGLEAFGGGSSDATAEGADEAPEEAGGGLGLAVGGVRMPDIALFSGQAELLAHVWAGAGSAATPVLRALRPLAEARGGAALLGGVRLHVRARGALALALDARAQASLWWRSAHAALELRAGGAALLAARARTAWGELSARAELRAAPRLRLAADLDFHAALALCVRAHTEPHALRRAVTLESRQGARRLRVRRRRDSSVAAPGRTLALGRPNDVMCRTLRSADSDEA